MGHDPLTEGAVVHVDVDDTLVRSVGSKRIPIPAVNGPTTIAWLEPWEQHLRRLGVKFEFGVRARCLHVEGRRVAGVEFEDGRRVAANDYVLAVPLEVARGLLNPTLAALDPALARLRALNPETMTEWMTGLQFFLRGPLRAVRGHVCYTDSPWALTSVAQAQFWEGDFASNYGDGSVQDVLSVDLSDWNTPGVLHSKPAKECTRAQIIEDVWEQLKRGLNSDGHVWLDDTDLHSVHFDENVVFEGGRIINRSPLLVHPPHSRAQRPTALTKVANLFLAADYVRTDTDLATMEGANEAARRAVNGILNRAGHEDSASLWPLTESKWLHPLREVDRQLFARGLPHSLEMLKAAELAQLLTLATPAKTRHALRSLRSRGRGVLNRLGVASHASD